MGPPDRENRHCPRPSTLIIVVDGPDRLNKDDLQSAIRKITRRERVDQTRMMPVVAN
jgi:hypothetical protein